MPLTYNSPTTPTGTGCKPPSSTYTAVFASGRPIGGLPLPANGSLMLAQTVTSVGPYALKNCRPSLPHRAAISAVHASPALIAVRNCGRLSLGNTAHTDGGSVTTVTSSSRINCTSGFTGNNEPPGASHNAAPVSSV